MDAQVGAEAGCPSPRAPAWDRAALLASPLLHTVHPLIESLPAHRFPTHDELTALALRREVVSGGDVCLEFIAPLERARGLEQQYEVLTFRAGQVQTRADNWHDLFNALAWLAFPRIKAMLNRLHAEEIICRGGTSQRSTARDVLTLFDEDGMIVPCSDASLAACLHDFRWTELFWLRRQQVRERMGFYIFGHALHEKALAPFRGITAKALVLGVEAGFFELSRAEQLEVLDRRVADHFAQPDALLSTRALQPLPILGIPGWCAENEQASYYDDTRQFRAGRRVARRHS